LLVIVQSILSSTPLKTHAFQARFQRAES